MIGNTAMLTTLCPHCANGVEEDAAKCPYCKADLSSQPMPSWLNRDEPSPEPRVVWKGMKMPIPSKFMWPGALLVVALIAFFTGWSMQRSEQLRLSQADSKQLQAKEQMIQSQEAQLSQARQQLNDSANQLAEMKTKFEDSQKELAATKQRLGSANREVARLNASRAAAATRTAAFPTAAGRTSGAGVYQTTRETPIYDNPSPGARVIMQIGRGTRLNVVNSAGAWLEVRSKHGNPPGYVRADDARLISRAN